MFNKSSNTCFLIGFCFLSIHYLMGQTTLVIESLPDNTPGGTKIFISGDFEGWTGGQDSYELKYDQGSYRITLPEQVKDFSFKFTRGSWGSVEVDQTGNQIDNRMIQDDESQPIRYFSIENWSDLMPGTSTAGKNVIVLSEAFDMPELSSKRKIWMYLPPDYDSETAHYPVLYMHDGQNLFDQKTSYNGEWEVDETLDALFEAYDFRLIVVGIENGGPDRIDEYSPWNLKSYKNQKKGDLYINFIVHNLKPFVDKNFRTLTGSQDTGIMGSSLGGLISHYAVLKYPGTFGKAALFSPSFELASESFEFSSELCEKNSSKLYFMAGDAESENMVPSMTKIVEQLKSCGYQDSHIQSKVVAGGEHHEKLWREEFKDAIQWLYNM